MAEVGWIKLYRSFLEWEWYEDINVRLVALHLLLKANISERKWQGVTIGRGQLITSSERLSEEIGISRQQIRTALNKLKECEFCNQQTTSRFTLVTICNYDTYQGGIIMEQPTDNQRITSNQPTDNQRITTTKEIKKERNKERKKKDSVCVPHTATHTHEVSEDFLILIQNYAPAFATRQWAEPLTAKQEQLLTASYTQQQICEALGQLHNKIDYIKGRSAYYTLDGFLKNLRQPRKVAQKEGEIAELTYKQLQELVHRGGSMEGWKKQQNGLWKKN